MKRLACFLTLALLAAPAGLLAQSSSSTDSSQNSADTTTVTPPPFKAIKDESPAPFSRLALSGGVGANGINMQVAVEANRYFNIRGIGNYFTYSITKTVSGAQDSGTLNFATGGVSVDVYPFPNHGLRFSPGVLFYNQNAITATVNVAGGKSFTMNSTTFYSSPTSPVTGSGAIALNNTNPAFTMTTGWGNLISRRGGHFSIPFEIGAAFVGSPTVKLNFVNGEVCSDSEGDPPCYSVTSYPAFTADVNAQVAKYNNDLNVLKVYPIMSIGIGYNFKIR